MKTIEVDGVEIALDVTAYVKWENRAKRENKTVAEILSFFLSAEGTTNP